MKASALLLAVTNLAFAITVVASVKSLGMIVKPLFGNVEVLLPPGASPLFWKPAPSQVEEALKADIFLNTLHWPFERQIAEARKGPTVPPPAPGSPGKALEGLGFAIVSLPGGGPNPHGWWLYAPNAFLIMSESAAYGCSLRPEACASLTSAYLKEVKASREVLESCRLDGKKAVVILPGEEYPLLNFGVKVIFVVSAKGPASVTGLQLRRAVEALRSADFLVISDASDKLPVTKFLMAEAKRMGKPVVKVYLLDPPADSFHEYLRLTCGALLEGK